jgi:hypothetical protein
MAKKQAIMARIRAGKERNIWIEQGGSTGLKETRDDRDDKRPLKLKGFQGPLNSLNGRQSLSSKT